MPSLKSYIQNTLSVRLTLWVVAIATLLFVAVMWIMLWFARQAVEGEAKEKARAALGTATLVIDNELTKVKTAVRNMQWMIEQRLDDPDAMMGLSRQMLETNPSIDGCNIAFCPDYYPQKGRNFMVFSHREKNRIVGNDNYADTNYDEQSWFANVVRTDSAQWADPMEVSQYVDHSIISYTVPLHGDGIVGVLSVDLSLDSLSNTIQANRPFPSAYCSMLDQNGSFIIHRNAAMLAPGSLKEQISKSQSDNGQQLAEAMMRGESGSMVMRFFDMDFYVFYCPFKDTGWSLNIVCPERDIFASYHQLWKLAIEITLVGILALILFCLVLIRWQLNPLLKLSSSTKKLAKGNFDHLLEKTNRADEIGNMQRVFREMQQSLSDLLAKIARQRSSLEEQGEALHVAYEHTKEAENAKRTFIRSATDKLTPPVAVISDVVGRIHQEHDHLSHDEIVKMTNTMSAQSKTVTVLLDRMIKVATESESITPSA